MSALDSQIEHVIEFIKVAGFLGGLGYTLFRVGRATERFEQVSLQQTREISDLKTSVDKLFDSSARLGLFEERQLLQGKRMDDLTARLNVHLDQQARYLMRAPGSWSMAGPVPEDEK